MLYLVKAARENGHNGWNKKKTQRKLSLSSRSAWSAPGRSPWRHALRAAMAHLAKSILDLAKAARESGHNGWNKKKTQRKLSLSSRSALTAPGRSTQASLCPQGTA